MKLEKLPDIIDDDIDYDPKENVNSLINTLDSSADKMKESISSLREMVSEEKPNLYFVKKEIDKVNSIIRNCVGTVYKLSVFSGSMTKEERSNMIEEKLVFSRDNGHLHIIFPSLLPRRIKKDSPLSHADIKQMYEPAFRKYFSDGKYRIYSQKAVIIYTHYFESQKDFVDHDNFETKVITDLITSWLLLDDSPKFCSIFMDYKIGEKCHTEVDVIPFSELKDFI